MLAQAEAPTIDIAAPVGRRFQLMVASRQREALESLGEIARSFGGAQIVERHITNGHCDPLYGLPALPHLLLFWLSEMWEQELAELIERPSQQRPPMLFVGHVDDPRLLRMAMKAGAMDYFRTPIEETELRKAIAQVMERHHAAQRGDAGKLIALMSAKGGAGSSFLACNIAHILQESAHQQVALLGMDVQFGSLGGYLDIEPQYGLAEVLGNIHDLDQAALRGFMTSHGSGLQLLDARRSELVMPHELDSACMGPLLAMLQRTYDQVIADLPRQIDMLTATVLERADRVVLVVQQSIAHLHDAQRLIKLLHRELDVSLDRIVIVINRFDRKHELDEQHMSRSLGLPVTATIPNAYEQVSDCVNGGQLLLNAQRRAPITRAVSALSDQLAGLPTTVNRRGIAGIFDRLRSN